MTHSKTLTRTTKKVCKTFIRRFDSDPRLQQNQHYPALNHPPTVEIPKYRDSCVYTRFVAATGPGPDGDRTAVIA